MPCLDHNIHNLERVNIKTTTPIHRLHSTYGPMMPQYSPCAMRLEKHHFKSFFKDLESCYWIMPISHVPSLFIHLDWLKWQPITVMKYINCLKTLQGKHITTCISPHTFEKLKEKSLHLNFSHRCLLYVIPPLSSSIR